MLQDLSRLVEQLREWNEVIEEKKPLPLMMKWQHYHEINNNLSHQIIETQKQSLFEYIWHMPLYRAKKIAQCLSVLVQNVSYILLYLLFQGSKVQLCASRDFWIKTYIFPNRHGYYFTNRHNIIHQITT